jgi:hypothetical protein
MEILFQVLLWIVETVGELVIEVGVDLAAQALGAVIGHGAQPVAQRLALAGAEEDDEEGDREEHDFAPREPLNPLLLAVLCAAGGWLAGLLSLWIAPDSAIKAHELRVASLILVPLASAGLMALVGSWLRSHDKHVVALERFSYGYCFASAVSVVRFLWASPG